MGKKCVGACAPGMFMEKLRDKAEKAGDKVIEFATRATKLSQTCHGCEPLLRRALLSLNETASGKSRLASFGLSQFQRQSGLHVEDRSMPSDAADVVRIGQPRPRELQRAR